MERKVRDDGSDAVRSILPGRTVVQEYLVEVLGGLVPGLLLLLGMAFALLPPLFDLHRAMNPTSAEAFLARMGRFFEALFAGPATLLLFVCLCVGLMTYTIGHVFYRRDPKEPDLASFRRLKRETVLKHLRRPADGSGARQKTTDADGEKSDGKQPKGNTSLTRLGWWLVRRKWIPASIRVRFGDPTDVLNDKQEREEVETDLRNNFGAAKEEDCQFPYQDFESYLKSRGFKYLTGLVHWKNNRSKLYINVFKMRLMQRYPIHSRPLIHNEAHVRLASGTWHVAGALQVLSAIGFLTVALLFALPRTLGDRGHEEVISELGDHFWMFLAPLSVLLVSFFLRWKIEGFFHYQRMREVVFVLESAYFAFRNEWHLLELELKATSPALGLPTAGAASGVRTSSER